MTDLLSIGASGINVYQRALSTVSNNIANLNTEGYSRQTTDIKQSRPVEVGSSFIGTGAYFDRVSRQYDSFLESSLRQATSDLENQGAAVEYTNRLLDVLGDEQIGLTSAFNKFFSAAKSLSTDPASPALRGVMLREASALVSRFNGLDDQFLDLGDQAISALETDIESINGLAAQIATVNKQMLRGRTELDQAPEILDRRDQLLRDLAEFAEIRTSFDKRGAVTVSLADSTQKGLLVSGAEVSKLSLITPKGMGEPLEYRLEGDVSNEFLPELRSGSAAGYAKFYEEILTQTSRRFDALATVFIDELNDIQTTGLDANGNVGAQFVAIVPSFEVDRGNSVGEFSVRVAATDTDAVPDDEIVVTFDAKSSRWSTVLANGQTAFANADGILNIDGMRISITGRGAIGDQFTVTPDQRAAHGMTLMLEDGAEIAAASFFRVLPATNNQGIRDPKAFFSGPQKVLTASRAPEEFTGPRPVSVNTSDFIPLTTIPAGQQSVEFTLDPGRDADLALQIVTQDGRHLVGSESIGRLGSRVSDDPMFADGASYDRSYLNQSGLNAYKDFELFYGARGVTQQATQLKPLIGFDMQAPVGSDFAGGRLDFTLEPATLDDRLRLEQSALIDASEGQISVLGQDIYLGQGLGADALHIGQIETDFNGLVQSLRVSFSNALPGGVVSGDLANQIAARVMYDNGRDLTIDTNTVKKRLSVDLRAPSDAVVVSRSRDFLSSDLVQSGAISETTPRFVSRLTGDLIANQSGSGRVLIDAGDLSLNGVSLDTPLVIGSSGVLSADDIKAWLNSAETAVTIDATNRVEVPLSKLELESGLGLQINGHGVTSRSSGSPTSFADAEDLVSSINQISSDTGVFAAISSLGQLVLQNNDLSGANIRLRGLESNPGANALGIASTTYVGTLQMRLETQDAQDIKLELGPNGTPADLNLLGLDTQVRLSGAMDEELLVYLNGSGQAAVSAEFESTGISLSEGLRARQFEFELVAEDRIRITDLTTDTIVGERAYQGELEIDYQGIRLVFDRPGAVGDRFVVDGNNLGPGGNFDAHGNNSNALRFVDLEGKGVLDGGLTLSEGYLKLVGDTGNVATQAQIARDALQIVQTQAVEARDRVSGVNLDKEAADLIRFQQAYQASAQVMQVATRLFDAILQVR